MRTRLVTARRATLAPSRVLERMGIHDAESRVDNYPPPGSAGACNNEQ